MQKILPTGILQGYNFNEKNVSDILVKPPMVVNNLKRMDVIIWGHELENPTYHQGELNR